MLTSEGVSLSVLTCRWRIHSTPHWTERHGLFITLAIGESVVAIGVGAAGQPISAPLLAAAVLAHAGDGEPSHAPCPAPFSIRLTKAWNSSTSPRCTLQERQRGSKNRGGP